MRWWSVSATLPLKRESIFVHNSICNANWGDTVILKSTGVAQTYSRVDSLHPDVYEERTHDVGFTDWQYEKSHSGSEHRRWSLSLCPTNADYYLRKVVVARLYAVVLVKVDVVQEGIDEPLVKLVGIAHVLPFLGHPPHQHATVRVEGVEAHLHLLPVPYHHRLPVFLGACKDLRTVLLSARGSFGFLQSHFLVLFISKENHGKLC